MSLSLGKAGSLVIVIQEPTAVINAKQVKREIGLTIDIVKALLNTFITLNVKLIVEQVSSQKLLYNQFLYLVMLF